MGIYPAILIAPAITKAIDTYLDPTFAGIHQLDWFDWAMLIPYFTVLVVLSVYGLHRYEMIRGYLKHKKKLAEGPPPSSNNCRASPSSFRCTTRSLWWSGCSRKR